MNSRGSWREKRRAALELAGYNILGLDPADIAYDLSADVVPWPVFEKVREAGIAALLRPETAIDLTSLAAQIYGTADVHFTTLGRTAEIALATALKSREPRIVTASMFPTAKAAFEQVGAKVRTAPGPAQVEGVSLVDLDWLLPILRRAEADILHVEASNNEYGGWRVPLEHLRELSVLCHRYGVLLYLDATRLMANAIADGESPLAYARTAAQLADLFTLGCSKELLCPQGGIVGIGSARGAKAVARDRLAMSVHALFHLPHVGRSMLAAGMGMLLDDPAPLADRAGQLRYFADALRSAGVPFLEPVGAHAVYVEVPASCHGNEPLRMKALDAFLFELTGIRGTRIRSWPKVGKVLMRLPLAVGRYRDQDLNAVAASIRIFLDRHGEAPLLSEDAGADQADLWRKFKAG